MNLQNIIDTLKMYRPAPTEAESEYDGPFSTLAEVHGATLGIGMGVAAALAATPGAVLPFVLTVMGYKGGKNKARSGHMKDAMQEPAYALGAAVVGYAVGAVANPAAIRAAESVLSSGVVRAALGF